jgi:D-sedoheptulose 7-phosphate isomerase
MESISEYIYHLKLAISAIPLEKVERIVNSLMTARRYGRQIFVLGNGGSASTASHFACDLAKGTINGDGRRFKVISLTDNVALMTAWSNDLSYDDVFKEQLENLAQPRDIVIGISASGNSRNVLNAIEYANSLGCITIGFAGFGGGQLAKITDECIIVDSYRYGPVEDIHLMLEHMISYCIAEELSSDESIFVSRGVRNQVATAD